MSFNPLMQRIVSTLGVQPGMTVCELGNQTWTKPDGTQVSAEEFYKEKGWSAYTCLDISDKWGARVIDLNRSPEEPEWENAVTEKYPEVDINLREAFDLVTNNGTGEHIFNQASVFEWVHALCKEGGLMVHVLPFYHWVNHGFYSFHPVLFRDLALANDYEVVGLFLGERNGRLERLDQTIDAFHHPKPGRPYSDIERAVSRFGERNNVSLVALLRKKTDAAFKFPVQGKYENDFASAEMAQAYKAETTGTQISTAKSSSLRDDEKVLQTTPALVEASAPMLLRQKDLRVIAEPFPHIIIENALPQDYYDKLVATAPTHERDYEKVEQNSLVQLDGEYLLMSADPVWREFVKTHTSGEWLNRLFELFEPWLKPYMEKLPSNLTIGLRGRDKTDLQLDCQLAFNTPTTEHSRVRGAHIDSTDEIIAGLLYMPIADETGDLILYKWKPNGYDIVPGLIGKAEAHDDLVKEISRVSYKPNTLILFLAGPNAIHGIDYRPAGQGVRRYVNLLVNANRPVWDAPPHYDGDQSRLRKAHRR